MARYITIVSVLAPVNYTVMERYEELEVFGDQSVCEVDPDTGISKTPLDVIGNLMGTVVYFFHDSEGSPKQEIDAFVRAFSECPMEVRKQIFTGGSSNYFYGKEDGTHFVCQFVYVLIQPDTDEIEDFFALGESMAIPKIA